MFRYSYVLKLSTSACDIVKSQEHTLQCRAVKLSFLLGSMNDQFHEYSALKVCFRKLNFDFGAMMIEQKQSKKYPFMNENDYATAIQSPTNALLKSQTEHKRTG